MMNAVNLKSKSTVNRLGTQYKLSLQLQKDRVQEIHLAQRLSSFLIDEYWREAQTNPNPKLRDLAISKVKRCSNLHKKFYAR